MSIERDRPLRLTVGQKFGKLGFNTTENIRCQRKRWGGGGVGGGGGGRGAGGGGGGGDVRGGRWGGGVGGCRVGGGLSRRGWVRGGVRVRESGSWGLRGGGGGGWERVGGGWCCFFCQVGGLELSAWSMKGRESQLTKYGGGGGGLAEKGATESLTLCIRCYKSRKREHPF